MKRINNIWIASLFVALLLAVGCASDFKDATTPEGSTITQIANTNADFNILSAALAKTGLSGSFDNNNSGAFTFFAPTDAAFVAYFNSLGGSFASFGKTEILNWINTTLSTSTTPNISTLSNILLYHVISSEIPSPLVIGAQGFTTLQGARLSLSKVGNDIILNANKSGYAQGNGSQSVTIDINASNGIIHSVNKVLIPVTTANTWTSTLLNFSVNYAVSPPAVTVYGTVLKRNSTGDGSINLSDATALAPTDASGTNYNLFSMAIARAELATIFIPIAQPFPDYTIFAPTDAAFMAYLGVADETAARAAINNLAPTALADILKYHTIAGRVLSTDLSDGQVLTTLTGKTITVGISGNTITLKDGNANISDPTFLITAPFTNTLTNAGVLHQINGVLRSN